MPDEHDGLAVDGTHSTNDGWIIQASSVSMQLYELVSDVQDDVKASGPVGVAGYLQPLMGRKPLERVTAQLSGRTGKS